MSFLEVRDISFSFPSGYKALSNITFSLEEGGLTLIAGKNGSGKTVLMKHLNGLLLPSSGDVLFRGFSTETHAGFIREKIGLVFQDSDSCLVGQTVWDDCMFGPENLLVPKKVRSLRGEEILRKLGLWEKRDLPPRFLSGGEKKKLTLAGILVMKPAMIILDEPFVGLDYPGVRDLLIIINALKKEGSTIIVISHDLEKILAHTDRLIIMEDGLIKADNTPELLLDSLEEYGIRPPPERSIGEMTWLTS